jgi:hypothetical protein
MIKNSDYVANWKEATAAYLKVFTRKSSGVSEKNQENSLFEIHVKQPDQISSKSIGDEVCRQIDMTFPLCGLWKQRIEVGRITKHLTIF